MDVRATTAPPNQSGLAFTHQGSVEGTIQINPRRDDSWSDHGFDRAIATNWNALATGGVTFNIDVNTDIGSVALAVGTDLTVGTLVVGGVVVALLTGGCDGQTRVYGDTEVTCGGGPPADNVP
jgi:hypothetical protein